MKAMSKALALAGASLLLPSCVAALVPLAAVGAIGGKQALGSKSSEAPAERSATAVQAASTPAPGFQGAANTVPEDPEELARAERKRMNEVEKRAKADAREAEKRARAEARAQKDAQRDAPDAAAVATPVPAVVAPPAQAVPASMQYLYGSGEAAAVSLQSYLGLMNYLLGVSSDRSVGHPVQSVVLAPNATLANITFEPCGAKPLAMVVDIDETMLLNLGFEGDQLAQGGAYDQGRWDAWEKSAKGAQVAAVPGALSAVNVARGANITVVFNSNRQAANADETAALLAAAGLGKAVHGDTLWLQGDAGLGSGKDARRAAISAKYCVVAMAGDQLGDFSDQFNAAGVPIAERRKLVAARDVLALWGHGWFIMPNPVYGTGVKGGMDEVFPPATRWTPQ